MLNSGRLSTNKVINNFGKKLINLCKTTGLRIVNGRKEIKVKHYLFTCKWHTHHRLSLDIHTQIDKYKTWKRSTLVIMRASRNIVITQMFCIFNICKSSENKRGL